MFIKENVKLNEVNREDKLFLIKINIRVR